MQPELCGSMAAITALHQKNSPLFRLPAELRNEIYYYALGGYDMILHEAATSGNHYAVPSKWVLAADVTEEVKETKEAVEAIPEPVAHGLALTQTCRQLCAETRLLPFQLNDFYGSFIAFEAWIKTLSPEQLHVIRTINLCIYQEEYEELYDRWCMAAGLFSKKEAAEYIASVSVFEAGRYIVDFMENAGGPSFETLMRPVLDILQNFEKPVIIDETGDGFIIQLWEDVVDGFENKTGMVVRLPELEDW